MGIRKGACLFNGHLYYYNAPFSHMLTEYTTSINGIEFAAKADFEIHLIMVLMQETLL